MIEWNAQDNPTAEPLSIIQSWNVPQLWIAFHEVARLTGVIPEWRWETFLDISGGTLSSRDQKCIPERSRGADDPKFSAKEEQFWDAY